MYKGKIELLRGSNIPCQYSRVYSKFQTSLMCIWRQINTRAGNVEAVCVNSAGKMDRNDEIVDRMEGAERNTGRLYFLT